MTTTDSFPSTFSGEQPGHDDPATKDPATDPATDPVTKDKARRARRVRRARRRAAKGLAWFALLLTAVFVLTEPWLLLPAAAMLVAIALWD
ncbi:hypothetical protein [Nonomuraea sp. NPDC050783]|uniref:hypothetical protein n=1 Tax=Nonomuraea sp. NPDC050783 TaxID=3154634 RepID=UPI0034652012